MKQNLVRAGAGVILKMIFLGCATSNMPSWYTVTGSGVADPSSPRAKARLMAKRAAKLDAQRQLLEHAKGVHIQSTTTVEDFMTRDDYIRSRVQGIIREAEIIDYRYFDDGSCEVDMRIDMNRIRDVVR